MNQIKIGKFIAECRKSKNMTQNQLAEMLNTTNKSVSKWENGNCLPEASLYEPLCDILGITINELFAGKKIKNEDYQRIADANLMQMLKHQLYQLSDKSITFLEFDNALNKMSEVTTILKQFGTKEEAVDYLVKETNLPIEECSTAYDYYINLFKID
ncbi:MAG: helix-turn-helix domain-containing protein [Acutalibacteraceae bacterium]|nr:helix-turn-helix domain-containing protein [Acutalibacteraceae bacterium]